MVKSKRILYCRLSECTDWVGNTFRCNTFWSPVVEDGRFKTYSVADLVPGDLIYFQPISPVIGNGTLSIVHGILADSGKVVLGNIHIPPSGLRKLNDTHIRGLI